VVLGDEGLEVVVLVGDGRFAVHGGGLVGSVGVGRKWRRRRGWSEVGERRLLPCWLGWRVDDGDRRTVGCLPSHLPSPTKETVLGGGL
jgi:hypothetical protein